VLLFVYGTLLRDEPNHLRLSDAFFVRSTQTRPQYELVDLGGYPALLEGGDNTIRGEIYEVDATLLEQLDAFEEVPHLYERKPIELIDGAVEAYVMPRERASGAPRIEDGDWRGLGALRRS
jgi:gamma-glutamylcyclotransferase (GGCT)/AIG2-like uncharacterized protein YtfP